MASTRINLEDFAGSPYARELQRHAWDMRFGDGLEAEYTASHVERLRLRARVWFCLSLLVTVFFAIRRVRSVGISDLEVLLHIGVLLPCVATLAWLSWSASFTRWYLPAARCLVPIYSIVVAALIARGIPRGDNQLAGLTVNVVAIFFFCGLMFREALATSVMMVMAFGLSALSVDLAAAEFIQSMVVLVLTVFVGAVVHKDVEKSHRTSFLEGALIGEMAARDGLTGLMNRRTFDEHLLRVWQHAMRDRQSIAVLMIDIDHFKEYNDAFGHQAGDVALRSVARAVQQFARRPLDLAARFGGEEFAIIIYNLPLEHVHDMAERIRHQVQNLQIAPLQAESMREPVTVSVGVCLATPTIGRTPQGAVQLADEALYEAKGAGRNRVVVRDTEDYRLLDTGAFRRSAAAG